jgi:signal transduction histidine kinase
MHPLDSESVQKHKAKAFPSNSHFGSRVAATLGIWINRIIRRWNIHQKIRYGYVLSLSIAVLGTGVGLIVGEHYDDKAVEQYSFARNKYELIDELEKAILKIQFYQLRILAHPDNSVNDDQEIYQLIQCITKARKLIYQLKLKLQYSQGIPTEDAVELKSVLQTYDTELLSFTKSVQWRSHTGEDNKQTKTKIQAAKQLLGMNNNRELSPKFEQLSKSLEQIVNSISEQRKQAERSFKKAKVLRVIIIITSMALSMAIALALALYTSRAIARPIKAVTNVAKRATQEGNFELQAPVTTEDEVGVLATSLNQLIQQVARQIQELKQAQAQLIQSEKMSSLGQMVAGIAHEINNPVNFIYANLDYANEYSQELLELVHLYQRHYPQPVTEIQNKLEDVDLDFLSEDLPKLLSSLHVGAERIRQIVLSLRNFCHLDEAERKLVDIHKEIDNTLLIMSHRLKSNIDLIKQYECLPLIKCYPAQLNQVFMNILSNAIDELLAHKELDQKQIVIQTRLVDDNQIEVRIRDNGPGIAPEIQDKIFDPFFTTKPVGQGTGMGLAICYQIVEKHHGKIEVISELGQGAEFVVTLPVAQGLA